MTWLEPALTHKSPTPLGVHGAFIAGFRTHYASLRSFTSTYLAFSSPDSFSNSVVHRSYRSPVLCHQPLALVSHTLGCSQKIGNGFFRSPSSDNFLAPHAHPSLRVTATCTRHCRIGNLHWRIFAVVMWKIMPFLCTSPRCSRSKEHKNLALGDICTVYLTQNRNRASFSSRSMEQLFS